MAPINFETQSGDHYEANYAPEFQRLKEPFEIAPGVVIPPGSYQFHRYRVQAESSDAARSRPERRSGSAASTTGISRRSRPS